MSKPETRPVTVEGALDRLVDYVTVLQRELPEIQRRLKAWRRDGYPSGSSGGGRGGGPVIVVPDELGNPDTVHITSVEAAVFTRDEVADMDARFNAQISEALGVITAVWKIRLDVMADTDETKRAKKRQDRLQKCANAYGCPDDAWGYKAGRCNTCYQFRYRNQRDRTGREEVA